MRTPELAEKLETPDTPHSETYITALPECEPDKGIYLDEKEIYPGEKLTELNQRYLGNGHKWVKEIDIRTRDCENLEGMLSREGVSIDDIIRNAIILVKQHQQEKPYDADVHVGIIIRDYGDYAYVDVGWKNGFYVFARTYPKPVWDVPVSFKEITLDQIYDYVWMENEAHQISPPSFLGISGEVYHFFIEHPKFRPQ